MAHYFTSEQADFISENVKGRTSHELTELVNKYFDLTLGRNQIRAYMKNHGLTNGINKKFKPGQEPPNKGKKGVTTGGVETQFKKGNKPWNYMPVGSERINTEGYTEIKIADPNKWKGKHILIWEEHNGPIPKGHAVIFGDRDNRNFNTDNLLLVSRKQLVRMNQHNLIQGDSELTKTGIVIADIYNKIGEVKRSKRKRM